MGTACRPLPILRAGGLGRFLVLLWLMLLVGPLLAAEVRVSVDRNPVPLDESFTLTFSLQGEVQGQPDFSVLEKDFQVLGSSRSLRTTFVNGKMERQDQYLVSLMARRAGRLTVPPVSFGKVRSKPLVIEVTPPAATPANGKADVFMEVSVDRRDPYVQQQVILTVRIFHRIQWRQASLGEPSFRGGEVLAERLGDDRSYQAVRNGQTWQVIERRYALFPQAHGKLEMDPLVLDLQVPSGERPARRRSPFGDPFFDDFFSRQNYVRKVVRSQPLTLQVKPVPPAFSGRHWLPAHHLELREEWSAPLDQLRAGEPVTRTITLVADGVTKGQLPDLVMEEVPGLRVYPDEAAREERLGPKGVRAVETRKFAIVPVKAGSYRIPPLEIRWWNLEKDREETIRLPEHQLQVQAGAGRATTSAPPTAEPGVRNAPASRAAAPATPPVQAASELLLQREPLVRWLLAGNLALLLLWLATLSAWLRERRRSANAVPETKEAAGERRIDERKAWRALHQAAEGEDPAALRDALLEVSGMIWPEQPPRSLEALARRADEPLHGMLMQLSRQLYAGEAARWDGRVIEEEMKKLAKAAAGEKQESAAGALRPLYPA